MKKYLLIILLYSSVVASQTPDKEGSLVKWITLDEAMEKVKAQQKPVIIDFYTDWCGWCKTMMKTTYADPNLALYINTYFYPVKFNAEGKDTVEFLGEKYFPVSDKPRTPHPLAAKLLNNKLMYPTTLFLNGFEKDKNEFKTNMIASGYLEAKKIEPILVFVLENASRNASYDDFNKYFQLTFHDTSSVKKQISPEWINPMEAFKKELPKKKKSLVLINTQWCTSCKVMKTSSFNDTMFYKYISGKFDLVDFNPEIRDTINFKGQSFTFPSNPEIPFHQLAVALGKNAISFPSLIVLDEKDEIIDVITSYVTPAFMNDIIHYFGDDIYKLKSWQDFIKLRAGKKEGS